MYFESDKAYFVTKKCIKGLFHICRSRDYERSTKMERGERTLIIEYENNA